MDKKRHDFMEFDDHSSSVYIRTDHKGKKGSKNLK